MSNDILLAPTPEIRAACDRIDDAIGRFIPACADVVDAYGAWGRFEADREATSLFKVVIRATEGVITLARSDLVLLPPAIMSARGAFETALKASWLVDCDDPFNRERRWLQHLASQERVYARSAAKMKKSGGEYEDHLREYNRLKSLRERIEAVFPEGYPPLPGLPSVESMVSTLHDDRLYLAYIVLSQFTHGERIAGSYYAPVAEVRRDAVKPTEWSLPLKVCWVSLFRAGRLLLRRLDGDPDSFMSEGEATEVQDALAAIT